MGDAGATGWFEVRVNEMDQRLESSSSLVGIDEDTGIPVTALIDSLDSLPALHVTF